MAGPGFDAAHAVRLNAQELDEYMRDLFSWSKGMKEKAVKRPAGAAAAPSPPVKAGAAAAAAGQQTPAAASGGGSAARHPAGHTYEHYREKWDKFDVDAALADEGDGARGGAAPPYQQQTQHGSTAASASRLAAVPQARVTVPVAPSQARAAAAAGAAGGRAAPTSAEGWKDAGNAAFKAGQYQRAADCYTSSLGLQPSCLAYANRAMAALKLGRAADAEADCGAALRLDLAYVKAYQRRATARRQLGRLLEAVEDCETALRLEPNNRQAAEDRAACVAALLRQQGLQPPARWERLPVVAAGHGEAAAPAAAAAGAAAEPAQPAGADIAVCSLQRLSPKPAAAAEEAAEPAQSAAQAGAVKPKTARPVAAIHVISGGTSDEEDEDMPDLEPTEPAPEQQPPAAQRAEPQPPTAQPAAPAAEQAAPAAAAPAAEQPPAPVRPVAATPGPFKMPRTGLDFERAWRGLKGDRQQQAAYLLALPPAALPGLLRQALNPGLLAAAAGALLRPGLQQRPAEAVALLEGLAGVPRFDINLAAVPAAGKAELSAAWDEAAAALAAAGIGDAALAGGLAAARQKYKL